MYAGDSTVPSETDFVYSKSVIFYPQLEAMFAYFDEEL